jgi:hypothetical protein
MNDLEEAIRNEKNAVSWCDKGDHTQAARCFIIAAFHYEMCERSLDQARCEGAWDAEMRWARPSAPVNISALVD